MEMPTNGMGEREKFCMKTPLWSSDDPGIAVSKGSGGNDFEG